MSGLLWASGTGGGRNKCAKLRQIVPFGVDGRGWAVVRQAVRFSVSKCLAECCAGAAGCWLLAQRREVGCGGNIRGL